MTKNTNISILHNVCNAVRSLLIETLCQHILSTINNVKDDDSLLLKACIAPYGNEDSEKQNFTSDLCIFVPTGISAFIGTVTMCGC